MTDILNNVTDEPRSRIENLTGKAALKIKAIDNLYVTPFPFTLFLNASGNFIHCCGISPRAEW